MEQKIKNVIALMRKDLAEYESKYNGVFAESPHIGLGNRKTRCVNEQTLPILTCSPTCLKTCANTCYVVNKMTLIRPACRKCQAKNTVLRRIDARRYYESFFREAEARGLPVRLSDGGDFESAEQVKACILAVRNHPTVQAIGFTKRIDLLPLFLDAPNNLHMRYSAWEGDEENTRKARGLGFDISHVVYDGSGNCPYQKSLAEFNSNKKALVSQIRKDKDVSIKLANKLAHKKTESQFNIHHCKDCALKGIGCCTSGDIKFNKV